MYAFNHVNVPNLLFRAYISPEMHLCISDITHKTLTIMYLINKIVFQAIY